MAPYSVTRIIFKLLAYRLKAKTVHQIHSPFVFNLVNDCLKVKYSHKQEDIEKLKRELRHSNELLTFTDYGRDGIELSRKVSTIARTSLKPKKYAELISKLCLYFKVRNALELGTSLGITSAYMARSIKGELHSFEGGESILSKAKDNWKLLSIHNIKTSSGPFQESILRLEKQNDVDLVFIDGHHQYEPTLSYFKHLMGLCGPKTVFVFDDIHWSKDMEKAWAEIKLMPEVRCTIDLFFIGLVFLNPELSKQDFVIKY